MLRVGRAVQLNIALSQMYIWNGQQYGLLQIQLFAFWVVRLVFATFTFPYSIPFHVCCSALFYLYDQLLLLVALNAVPERSWNGGTRGQAASHSSRSGETPQNLWHKYQYQNTLHWSSTEMPLMLQLYLFNEGRGWVGDVVGGGLGRLQTF